MIDIAPRSWLRSIDHLSAGIRVKVHASMILQRIIMVTRAHMLWRSVTLYTQNSLPIDDRLAIAAGPFILARQFPWHGHGAGAGAASLPDDLLFPTVGPVTLRTGGANCPA